MSSHEPHEQIPAADPDESPSVFYYLEESGKILYRVADGEPYFGDGWVASALDGAWIPEEKRTPQEDPDHWFKGIAWHVSGMGGADFSGKQISRSEAMQLLREWGIQPDEVDQT